MSGTVRDAYDEAMQKRSAQLLFSHADPPKRETPAEFRERQRLAIAGQFARLGINRDGTPIVADEIDNEGQDH